MTFIWNYFWLHLPCSNSWYLWFLFKYAFLFWDLQTLSKSFLPSIEIFFHCLHNLKKKSVHTFYNFLYSTERTYVSKGALGLYLIKTLSTSSPFNFLFTQTMKETNHSPCCFSFLSLLRLSAFGTWMNFAEYSFLWPRAIQMLIDANRMLVYRSFDIFYLVWVRYHQ